MPQVHAEESPSWLLVRTEAPQNSSLMPTQESPLILAPEASGIAELTLTHEESSIMTTPSTPIAESVALPVETNTEVSPLFAFGSIESEKTENAIKPSEVARSTESVPPATVTEGSVLSGQKIFHPKEFIEKSITDIDVMIGEIDQAHDAKIQEAEWYGNEKKHFAELEKATYGEARTLDDEKSHALHVRNLLEGELGKGLDALQKNHTSASVETAMTGIAVQNTVTETMESKKEVHKKPHLAHKKKELAA